MTAVRHLKKKNAKAFSTRASFFITDHERELRHKAYEWRKSHCSSRGNSSSSKGEIVSVSSCRPSTVSQVKHTCHTWCPRSHMLCSSPASQFHAIHECQPQQTLRSRCSVQHLHATWNENKWFLACLRVPVLFAIVGWGMHPMLGQNLRCILWNISVEIGTLNVKSHSETCRGLKAHEASSLPALTFPVWRLLSVYLSLLLMPPPQCMHFVHRLPAPYLQRLHFQRWSEVSEAGGMGNTAVIYCPLCSPLTLMTDTGYSPPIPLEFTTLSAGCEVGGSLRIWAHQYTHHLLFFCIALTMNTIYSLHKDNVKLTSFIKWHVRVLVFIPWELLLSDSCGFKVIGNQNQKGSVWGFAISVSQLLLTIKNQIVKLKKRTQFKSPILFLCALAIIHPNFFFLEVLSLNHIRNHSIQ